MTTPTTPDPARPHRGLLAVVLAVVLGVAGALAPPLATGLDLVPERPAAAAEPGDVGWEGPAFWGSSGSPSGSKPQSKVWHHDDRWWADLWDADTGIHRIHWLDTSARAWVPTATTLDVRSTSRSDVLAAGNTLYVASHRFGEGSTSTPTGHPAELRRLTYDPADRTYSLDPGFPVQINDARSETLVIARDSTGRLWATWTQDGKVMVSVSTVGGASWGTPFIVPTGASTVTADDISSVVAFEPGRIGVLWSNQADDTFWFAHRSDSDPAGSWSPAEVAYTGPSTADDHINLSSVTDQDGRVLAAVKTSRTGDNPLNVLIDRNPWSGTWEHHTFGTGRDHHTRPVVAVDRETRTVHMFATGPESGGTIYEKSAPLDAIAFPSGPGTPVLVDADSDDINNATTTKQPVDSSTGLVVLATNDSTRQYWTHFDPLGGDPPPPPEPPDASFTADPTSGTAPLDVTFTDTSSGHPTTRTWDFGDGATAISDPAMHTYTEPGTYTASLTVANAAGSSTTSTTITVEPGVPPGPITTFEATADAAVKSTSPDRSYGDAPWLRTRSGSPEWRSYLRFAVTGLDGPPTAATLRLWTTDPSRDGGTVSTTSPTWDEDTLTWSNAPATGPPIATIGTATAGTWIDIDVTDAVTGNGPVALALAGLSSQSGYFASREAGPAPQLVVETGNGPPPPPPIPQATFTADPVSGTAPLEVTFTNTTYGLHIHRWDFGDGASVLHTNPVTHTYTEPGTYTARLAVANASGFTTATTTITVVPDLSAGPSLTLEAEADAAVKSSSPTRSDGDAPWLRTRTGTPEWRSYLRFAVTGLSGPPRAATLRLWTTDPSRDGGTVSTTSPTWDEDTLTWSNAPATGPPIATIGTATAGTWIDIDVTDAVTGNGPVALALAGLSSQSGYFASREAGPAPQLVLIL